MDESDRLSALRDELTRRLGRSRYDLWVGDHVKLEFVQDILSLTCSSKFELQGIKRRLHTSLVECSRDIWGRDVCIRYFESARSISPAAKDEVGYCHKSISSEPSSALSYSSGSPSSRTTFLSGLEANSIPHPSLPKTETTVVKEKRERAKSKRSRAECTFNTFVVGSGNEMAFRTASAVAKNLGHYGPLLIYGQPGVGKTHLLQAIATESRKAAARPRTLCIRAEQFTSEFLDALNRRTLPGFRQRVRETDLLLVDDIHFFQGKAATLDELVHTVEALCERGKQVVLSADRSPGDYRLISSDLVSRISDGLAIQIEPPDFSTRVGLIRNFLMRMHPTVASDFDEQVIDIIAAHVMGSARQVQGAINRVVVASEAMGEKITPELAGTILREYTQQNSIAVRLADIQSAVCQVFGVDAKNLKSPRKTRSITEPRTLAMWLSCKLTRAALGEIGEYFGRRSHSTVISAQRKVEQMVSRGAQVTICDRECTVEEALRKIERLLRTA